MFVLYLWSPRVPTGLYLFYRAIISAADKSNKHQIISRTTYIVLKLFTNGKVQIFNRQYRSPDKDGLGEPQVVSR